MFSSNWPYSSKVSFGILEKEGEEFLVCHSNASHFQIRYLENLKTGVRKFPTDEQRQSASSSEELLDIIISSF